MSDIDNTLKIAVIGAGPSGLYSIDHLLSNREYQVEVDLFDRLPTPWGLVRNGVAPDHPEKKSVIERRFESILYHPAVRFFGNVEIGRDLTHQQLETAYHAVIYAIGCEDDRRLGIPGEELSGCWGAREFVAWYNGHPDYSHLKFDFSSERAIIIGNGNVAIDIARILLKTSDQLARSEISDLALEALEANRIKEVVVLGRRGCVQASFHSQMLAEMGSLGDVSVEFENDTDFIPPSDPDFSALKWGNKQKLSVMYDIKQSQSSGKPKKVIFRFLGTPLEVMGSAQVDGLKIAETRLELDDKGIAKAVSTNETTELSAGLILRSIGYSGQPISGLPFIEGKGIIPNEKGRVVREERPVNGTYVTGWIKRGPSGVIGSNRKCAGETVECLLEDARAQMLSINLQDQNRLLHGLAASGSKIVSRDDWDKIAQQEALDGRLQNRPRVKIVEKEQLLARASS